MHAERHRRIDGGHPHPRSIEVHGAHLQDGGADFSTVPAKKEFTRLRQHKAQPKGRSFKEMHWIIMVFNGQLRGAHHHKR